jgi:hypothetical protein
VSVSADRQTATVGDRITLTVKVEHHKDWQQIPQPLEHNLGPFDILHDTIFVDRWGEGDDRLNFNRELVLAIFEPGGAWIPSLSGLTVMDGDTVAWRSDSLAIMIESVLDRPDADTTDIAGLKGPYVAPISRWYWWAAGVAALVAVAAYSWYRRRKRAALPRWQPPPIPAWDAALHELEGLRREGQRAEEFLHLADRVRYAKQPATEGRPEVDWEWVRSFVKETIPLRIASEADRIERKEDVPGT